MAEVSERRRQMEAMMQRVIEASRSSVSVAAIEVRTGETIEVQADVPREPASAIKVMHLVELMCRVEEGTESFETMMPCTPPEGHAVGQGSGIIQFFRPGVSMSLHDLAVMMIIASDNIATDILWRRFGAEAMDRRAAALGVRTSFAENPKSCLGGKISAMDMARLMAELACPRKLNPKAAKRCLELLKYQQFQATLNRWLPDYQYGGEIGKKFVIANKPGYSGGTRTDVGACFSEESDWAIAVMVERSPKAYDTVNPTDRPGMIAIARVSRLVHDYFRGRAMVDVMTYGPA